MGNFLIIYCIGVIISYFVIAYINDKNFEDDGDDDDNLHIGYIFLSWFIIFCVLLFGSLLLISNFKPSLKSFKKFKIKK